MAAPDEPTVSLRSYVEQLVELRYQDVIARIAAQDRAVGVAMSAAEKASDKAEDAASKRFDSVNEFRGQLADQAKSFMNRETAEALFAALQEKIDNLRQDRALTAGKSLGMNALWALIVGGIMLAVLVYPVIARGPA
jgi:uncharacterized protein YicC (UPF0701 family)